MQQFDEKLNHSTSRTLQQIVDGVMRMMKLFPEDDEDRLYQYCESFLRDLKMDTYRTIKVFRNDLANTSNKTIPFPPDMAGWLKIGYESGTQVVANGLNENLAINPRVNTPAEQQRVDEVILADSYPYKNFYGRYLRPSPPVPTFRIDFANRVIVLDANIKLPNFYMEYISDCLDISNGLIVHPFFQTALEMHLMFWVSMHTPNRKSDASGYKGLLDVEIERMRERVSLSGRDIFSIFKQVMY